MVHVFQKSSAMVRDYFKIRKISRDRKLPKFFSIPDFFLNFQMLAVQFLTQS